MSATFLGWKDTGETKHLHLLWYQNDNSIYQNEQSNIPQYQIQLTEINWNLETSVKVRSCLYKKIGYVQSKSPSSIFTTIPKTNQFIYLTEPLKSSTISFVPQIPIDQMHTSWLMYSQGNHQNQMQQFYLNPKELHPIESQSASLEYISI